MIVVECGGTARKGWLFVFSPVILDSVYLLACCRAMLEDGDPLDMSPLLQVGLILESLGDIEEAAVRRAVTQLKNLYNLWDVICSV